MHLNVAHKIFGIAAVVLVMMVAAAIFSINLTEEISDDLEVVARRHLPLSDAIAEVNVRLLEQGILLQRLFALPHESPGARKRLEKLEEEIEREFDRAWRLFRQEERTAHPPENLATLEKALESVEREYRIYEEHGEDLLKLHLEGDEEAFRALVPDLNRLQDAIDAEIDTLRRHVETIADTAVVRADASERELLWFNTILTGLAALMGLGFASVVSVVLVRNIRDLVRGAEAVENGDLDVAVRVATRDEVGRLTRSFNHMVDGLRLKERIQNIFGMYMDPRIVSDLIEHPELTRPGGERREMTVLFVDLKGFTPLAESLPANDLVRLINLFYGHMTDAIGGHSGVVKEFLGDAVMAFWGPPFTSPEDHARLACLAALDALRNLERYREELKAELGPGVADLDIDLRIGVASGEMVVGTLGSMTSRAYGVLGDNVNLGARLEGANKAYGTRVIVSERTRNLAGDAVRAREVDLIRVKGKTRPTRIFELLPEEVSVPDIFAEALAAYRRQDWQAAKAAFAACRDAVPDDPVPPVFLERTAYLEEHPPGPDWDGVWTFTTK